MRFYYLLIVFWLVSFAGKAQSWQWVSPWPQGNSIYTSQLLDDGTAYMAGSYGTLLKSTNAGASWTVMQSLPAGVVRSIFFVNPDRGFAVAEDYDSSFLYKTTDGGISWDSTIFPGRTFRVVWFMDDTTGFIGGDWGLIMKTTDGGNSWTDVPYSETLSFSRFSALNPQVIYTSSLYNGAIVKSTDGGQTWDMVIDGIADSPFVHYFDEQTGIFAGIFDSYIYKTYNGGSGWYPKNNEYVYATSMRFFDGQNGIISSRNGDIRHTTDQGETWQLTPSALPSHYFTTASFTSMQQGIMGGLNGQLAYTADGGLTLTPASTSISDFNLMGMSFVNDSIGFVGSDHGRIYKTTNRWLTADTLLIPWDASVYKVDFPTAQTGYALAGWGGYYHLYRTSDGGATFEEITSLIGDMYDIRFFDENTGILVSGGDIKRTTDGGITWSYYYTDPEFVVTLATFANNSTGYVAGYNWQNQGIIYKTTDGGENWERMTFPIPHFQTIQALSADTLYAATLMGWFYKSTDGGISWDSDDNFTEAGFRYVHAIEFYDSNRGVCTGSDMGNGDLIGETYDGGETWVKQITTENYIGNLTLVPETATYYVTGQLGTMLRKTDSTVVATPRISLPHQTLSIYPNPSTGNITISLPGITFKDVTVDIFNSQGRMVYTKYKAGPVIEVTSLKAGVYFVRVTAGKVSSGGVLVVK